MSAPRKYDQEFRERAVRMYQERLAETGECKRSVRRHVGSLLDVNAETLLIVAGRDARLQFVMRSLHLKRPKQ